MLDSHVPEHFVLAKWATSILPVVVSSFSNQIFIECHFNSPNNSVIKNASIGNYDDYYEQEISRRKDLNYFPYCDVNKISITGEFKELYHFANYFKKVFTRIVDGEILGPVYDIKIKGVKLIIKHNDFEKVVKIYNDTKIALKDKDIQTSFERKPKVI